MEIVVCGQAPDYVDVAWSLGVGALAARGVGGAARHDICGALGARRLVGGLPCVVRHCGDRSCGALGLVELGGESTVKAFDDEASYACKKTDGSPERSSTENVSDRNLRERGGIRCGMYRSIIREGDDRIMDGLFSAQLRVAVRGWSSSHKSINRGEDDAVREHATRFPVPGSHASIQLHIFHRIPTTLILDTRVPSVLRSRK